MKRRAVESYGKFYSHFSAQIWTSRFQSAAKEVLHLLHGHDRPFFGLEAVEIVIIAAARAP